MGWLSFQTPPPPPAGGENAAPPLTRSSFVETVGTGISGQNAALPFSPVVAISGSETISVRMECSFPLPRKKNASVTHTHSVLAALASCEAKGIHFRRGLEATGGGGNGGGGKQATTEAL
jgi:hypothetical protein